MLNSCVESCNAVLNQNGKSGNFYELVDTDINGQQISFERFRGKVVLVVNVASYCGYTAENYDLFRSLRKYIDWGLEIVIFPCNQFGSQEPGSSADIVQFAKQQKFEGLIMSKADVNGPHTSPTFKFLKQYKGNRDIGW